MIAVGETVGRKIGRLQRARAVKLDRAFHAAAGALDQEIADADGLRVAGHGEGRPRRLARLLDPTRQETVDLGRRQVGRHRKAAVVLGRGADPAGDIDRNGAADRVRRIEPESVAHRLVEHALNMDVGFRLAAQLPVFETGRRAADLDVALERKALIIGADFQIRGLDLLPHDHAFGGKIRGVDGDGVVGRSRRQIGLERHGQSDQRTHRAVRRRRIERHLRGVAQAVHGQKLDSGRHRAVDLKVHARRRRVRRGVGHFEQTRRQNELASGGQVGRRFAERDLRIASDDVNGEIGVVQRRQARRPAGSRNSSPAHRA